MKVKVLRGFALGNGVDATVGESIEVSDDEARILIQQGKVESEEESPDASSDPAADPNASGVSST